MITVTIKPTIPIDQAIAQIQTRYPSAFHNESRVCEPGRYACTLPSKDQTNWTMQDAEFFNDLAYKDNVLVSWATLGGPHGRDFTE